VNANDALVLAGRLMDEFELEGWTVEFDRSVVRFGCCHRDEHRISLSLALVTRNPVHEVEEVIRHEIAHALAPPRSGHNAAWVAQCRVVGIAPERCYNVPGRDVVAVEAPWTLVCDVCGMRWPTHRRRNPDMRRRHTTDGGVCHWERAQGSSKG
jgi:predicted SprT family Zn-dependent metalloprotease